ncbi:unnamed protein product [Prorocentrum cordatum]|uniref:Pseudouridine synthase RsuA/RluA-like domain-containing protein n=1 Tax=Prorocentrum cordatum TaxID=2364126 RepID=A0ABN9WNC2_9DINO|nr:unnamed protein product [Polarella glacialis]
MGPRELPAGGGAVAGGAASDAACSDPGRAPGGDANAGGAAGGGQLLEGVTPRRLRQLQLTALLEKQKVSIAQHAAILRDDAYMESWYFEELAATPAPESAAARSMAEALCVVCKPPDVRVDVPRRRPDYYAADEPLRHFPEEVTVEDWFLGRYRGEKFRLVNQLDFATSGILVLGRTKEGAAWASAALRTKEDATASSSDKVYDCIVCGSVVPAEGTISAPIRDRCKGSFERVVDEADDCDAGADRATLNWQFAETEFTVRKRGVYAGGVPASLLRVQLRTGRRHQIRVHLAHIGHPVLGDDTYCRSEGRVGQGLKDDRELYGTGVSITRTRTHRGCFCTPARWCCGGAPIRATRIRLRCATRASPASRASYRR